MRNGNAKDASVFFINDVMWAMNRCKGGKNSVSKMTQFSGAVEVELASADHPDHIDSESRAQRCTE